MKSVLSGVSMKHYLSFRTFVAKSVGLFSGLASGLSIGKVGPYSHICSTISDQMCNLKMFKKIKNNNALKIQMMTCACAVGVSIGFGAPLGFFSPLFYLYFYLYFYFLFYSFLFFFIFIFILFYFIFLIYFYFLFYFIFISFLFHKK